MSDKKKPQMISTPCTNVCTLDFDTGYCYGCGRDRMEIAQWGNFDEERRKEIMSILPKRLQAIEDSI